MNPIDELLAQAPLVDLISKLQSFADEASAKQYIFDRNNKIIETLAVLSNMPSGQLALSGLLENVYRFIGRSKGALKDALDVALKELRKQKIQERAGSINVEELHVTKGGELVSDYHQYVVVRKNRVCGLYLFSIRFRGHTFWCRSWPVEHGRLK